MPGSSNFVGEFMILLGTFRAKLPIAVIAFLGVVGAAYYALRVFIGSMHDRVGQRVASREIGMADFAAIAPIVLVILVLAFYPQFGLRRSEPTVKASIAPAAVLAGR
jgi:NADH-quinone oxidoreductase subunit M